MSIVRNRAVRYRRRYVGLRRRETAVPRRGRGGQRPRPSSAKALRNGDRKAAASRRRRREVDMWTAADAAVDWNGQVPRKARNERLAARQPL